MKEDFNGFDENSKVVELHLKKVQNTLKNEDEIGATTALGKTNSEA